MRRVSGVLFTLLLFAASSSTLSAQQGIYMLVDSIRGDQTAPHNREFKLNGVSFAATNTATIGSGTGLTTGKAAFPPVKVSIRFHAVSSPAFYKAVIAGTKLPAIEIRFYNATNQLFYKTVFENVYLTSVATEGSDEAVQQIEFAYARVKHFAPADPAGLNPPQQVGCWDITLNRTC